VTTLQQEIEDKILEACVDWLIANKRDMRMSEFAVIFKKHGVDFPENFR
jgi:hypothetical protein